MKIRMLILFCFLSISCSNMSYYWHVSTQQMSLLSDRVSIEEALKENSDLTEEDKKKLSMVAEIKKFTKETLELDIDEDVYSEYVHLDQEFVTWILRVSRADALEPYLWDFLFTGKVSYKGFFDEEKALEEEKTFSKKEYDTYVRGVRAYSLLGYLDDPILSSMLVYPEEIFALVIFHELVHTILWFKDHVDFNERVAEFVGRKAVLQFYKDKEGENSSTVQKMLWQWEDELLFSSFMSEEYRKLDEWYKEKMGDFTPEIKAQRLREIQDRFLTQIKAQLKNPSSYDYFTQIELNNAKLLSYRSYNYNMEEFEKIFNSPAIQQDIAKFVEYCFQFEDEEDPEQALKEKSLLL